ncbi:MAG: hypothetical protein COA54_10225 [Thiotrichaceae bacterium]|nr:MAG: hypothetical protein COA54_10225 [Thiotrichaceae bacterium]
MNTLTSLKQNISKIAAILLVLTQLVGCYAETGADSKDRTTAFDNEIVNIDDNTTIVSDAKIFSWTAPVAREDESPIAMSEIAGYRIYFGTETGNYSQSIEVDDAYIDVITLDALNTAGTYYIVITTVDTDGRESTYSEEIVLNV